MEVLVKDREGDIDPVQEIGEGILAQSQVAAVDPVPGQENEGVDLGTDLDQVPMIGGEEQDQDTDQGQGTHISRGQDPEAGRGITNLIQKEANRDIKIGVDRDLGHQI